MPDSAPAQPDEGAAAVGPGLQLLDRWIGFWASVFDIVGALYWLGRDAVGWMWRAFVLRRVRIGSSAITAQIVRVGVRSIPIVMLVSGSIGIILALQTSRPARSTARRTRWRTGSASRSSASSGR